MRTAEFARKTNETEIKLSLELDGSGKYDVKTGCGFLDHMLELFAKHGRFDLSVDAKGDTKVDYHHTADDIGIVLGKVFKKALGDKTGIKRYGSFLLPMDEALVLCAVDISGRSCLVYSMDIPAEKIGDFDTELLREFWTAFSSNAGITIHFKQFSGLNSHHIAEASFKAAARSLKEAVSLDMDFPDDMPSSKGVLE